MKIGIYILILVLLFFYASDVKICFKPFKIYFNDLPYAIGFFLIIIGVVCIQVSGYRKGNLEGYKEAISDVKTEVSKIKSVENNKP